MGAKLVFADFHKVVICTKKTEPAAAKAYCDHIVKTVSSRPLFAWLTLEPTKHWQSLLFMDNTNYGGYSLDMDYALSGGRISRAIAEAADHTAEAVTTPLIDSDKESADEDDAMSDLGFEDDGPLPDGVEEGAVIQGGASPSTKVKNDDGASSSEDEGSMTQRRRLRQRSKDGRAATKAHLEMKRVKQGYKALLEGQSISFSQSEKSAVY